MNALITEAMVDAALDEWYPGEDWRTILPEPEHHPRAQMRAALLAALTAERDRWQQDSMTQAATINRMAAAAEDRNAVDQAREQLHAEDLAAQAAEIADYRVIRDNLEETVAEKMVEITRLREALLFYADVSKYPAPLTGGMGALWEDCGGIARAVLGDKP